MQAEVKSDMTHPSINGPLSKVLNFLDQNSIFAY